MTMTTELSPNELTPAQRQLRSNIRNAYYGMALAHLIEARRYRAMLGRSEFELSVFDELIKEFNHVI